MDGEVLIIGKVVGWSGGIPKGLTSGPGAALVGESRSLFFSTHFREGLRSVFFDFCVHFGGFWEAETDAKIDFSAVFFRCFSRVRICIDFGWIFGASEPEKSTKTIVFSMVFVNFHKIDVFETYPKIW